MTVGCRPAEQPARARLLGCANEVAPVREPAWAAFRWDAIGMGDGAYKRLARTAAGRPSRFLTRVRSATTRRREETGRHALPRPDCTPPSADGEGQTFSALTPYLTAASQSRTLVPLALATDGNGEIGRLSRVGSGGGWLWLVTIRAAAERAFTMAVPTRVWMAARTQSGSLPERTCNLPMSRCAGTASSGWRTRAIHSVHQRCPRMFGDDDRLGGEHRGRGRVIVAGAQIGHRDRS